MFVSRQSDSLFVTKTRHFCVTTNSSVVLRVLLDVKQWPNYLFSYNDKVFLLVLVYDIIFIYKPQFTFKTNAPKPISLKNEFGFCFMTRFYRHTLMFNTDKNKHSYSLLLSHASLITIGFILLFSICSQWISRPPSLPRELFILSNPHISEAQLQQTYRRR